MNDKDTYFVNYQRIICITMRIITAPYHIDLGILTKLNLQILP